MESSNVMNGGEGLYSYAKNSVYQRSSLDVVGSMIEEEISSNLDTNQVCLNKGTNCFLIADFGCSTGHNSLRTMELIMKGVEKKYAAASDDGLISCGGIPEFQLFFNDQVTNDFNTLFTSLPVVELERRNYYVAGVPGPFHGRLFPKSSLHMAHSAWSLHWLSRPPNTTRNKGRIHYLGAPKEVFDAYSDQFDKDIKVFLEARAQELVGGGLMTLLVPAVPCFWDPETTFVIPTGIQILGSCLVDILKERKLNEQVMVDSFNVPLYMPTPEQLKLIIESNCDFRMQRMEILSNPGSNAAWNSPKAIASFYRSVAEGMMRKYLESEIIDELFSRFENKLSGSPLFRAENDKTIIVFIVLKRKNE